MKIFLTLIVMVIVAVSLLGVTYYVQAVETSAQSHRLNYVVGGNASSYLEHGEAIRITNNCGKDVFLPANSTEEWTSLNNSAPSCLTTNNDFVDCQAATGQNCGGTLLVPEFDAGGATYALCLIASADQPNGTCLSVSGGDFDCRLWDGDPTGSGSATGACTDYN